MTIPPDAGQQLRGRMGRDLLAARKARDDVRVRALRSVLGAIDNAGAVDAPAGYDFTAVGAGVNDVPRRRLEAPEIRRLLETEIAERREAAATYRTAGQTAAADDLDHECAAIEPYLPILDDTDAVS